MTAATAPHRKHEAIWMTELGVPWVREGDGCPNSSERWRAGSWEGKRKQRERHFKGANRDAATDIKGGKLLLFGAIKGIQTRIGPIA